MKLPVQIARPSKFTNGQTILYEIDMVRFTAGNFENTEGWSAWCNLECFLLHFRNLIEFFGKKPTRDDLSIHKPKAIWPDAANRPPADTLRRFHREDLWQKYEVRDATQVNDKISRYLQHCTEQRVDAKSWRVREMFEELDPLMSGFEKLLPDTARPWRKPSSPDVRIVAMQASYSTASPAAQTFVLVEPNPKKDAE